MEAPAVSIIVPVYNVEPYLNKCITSILNQTFENFELILVDDGSTDKSADICDEWKSKDERICVIHKPNGGLSDARNAGLDRMSGNYVFFVDSDDYLLPDALSCLYGAIKGKTRSIAVLCEEQVWENRKTKEKSYIKGIFSPEEALLALFQGKIPEYAHGKLYPASLWENIRFPVGRAFEDISTTYKVFFLCDSVHVLDQVGYCYLQRQGSITDRAIDNRRDAILAYKEQLAFAKKYCVEAVPVLNYKIEETGARLIVLENYIQKKKPGDHLEHYREYVKRNRIPILCGRLVPTSHIRCRMQILVLISPNLYGNVYLQYVKQKRKLKKS